MKKFFFVFAFAFLFSFSAFADYVEPTSGTWDNQPIPFSDSSEPSGFRIGTLLADGSEYETYLVSRSVDASCYAFFVSGSNQLWVVSDYGDSSSHASVSLGMINKTYQVMQDVSNIGLGAYDDTTGLYYGWIVPGNIGGSPLIPVYSSSADGLASVRYKIDNPPIPPEPPAPRHNASFALPAGNVAFVDFGSSGQDYLVTATTQFYTLSGLTSGQFSPVTQRWYWTDVLPQDSGSLSDTGLVIPWYKAPPYNIFKQSHNAFVNSGTMVLNGFWGETTDSRYLVIVNPYYNVTNINADRPNHDLQVNVENAVSVKVYSLTESWNSSGTISESVDSTNFYDGSFQEDGSTAWTDENGSASSPQFGGDNYVPPAETAEGIASQIKTILEGLVEKITGMFTATHTAISRLISVSSEFFSKFGLLYAWLPSDVYSTLQSGMIVAVTIGVLKAFL